MTAITSKSLQPSLNRFERALQPVLSSLEAKLIRLIADYMAPDFSNQAPRTRVYTKKISEHDDSSLRNHCFYSFNSQTRRGEIIHFKAVTSLWGWLEIHEIESEREENEPKSLSVRKEKNSIGGEIICVLADGASFDFYSINYRKEMARSLFSLTDPRIELGLGQVSETQNGPVSLLPSRDDVQYCRDIILQDVWTPYPIQLEQNFKAMVSYMHGDFFFVGGYDRSTKIPTAYCWVYSKSKETGFITRFVSGKDEEMADLLTKNDHIRNGFSLFANESVVAMTHPLEEDHVFCTIWELHSWRELRTIKTQVEMWSHQCVAIENGTVAISAQTSREMFIEYFDFN